MGQGRVENNVTSGGGKTGAGASALARVVIALGVCTDGLVNTLYNVASSKAIAALGGGPLLEYASKLLLHGANNVYLAVVTPSAAGAVGSVVQAGSGAVGTGTVVVSVGPWKAIKIKCTLGGTVGTMKVRFSLDGGVTYGAEFTSSDTGGGSYAVLVPGTFTTVSFAAATYVVNKTCTIGVDGSVTNGALWVGVVTQVSSPLDSYNALISVVTAGALGVAVVSPSLDGGLTTLPNIAIPTGGVVVIPNTGLVLTFASTFVAGNTYAFPCSPPGFSTSDLNACVNAVRVLTNAPQVALLHCTYLPNTAAGAIAIASALETQCASAKVNNSKFWQAMSECPSAAAGDVIVDAGAAVVDSADTDAVIRAAREGMTFDYTSVFVATQEMPSGLSGFSLRRPVGWGIAARYVEADPREDVSDVGRGPLDFIVPNNTLHRDDLTSATPLFDAQFNTLKTYPGRTGAYLTLEEGGTGWRNMTVDPNFQDAGAVRVLNLFLNGLNFRSQKYLGSHQDTNADGTIAEGTRQVITSDLDGGCKLDVGLEKGGEFDKPQASSASASVLATSQLGQAPKRLDVQYRLQKLGQITGVRNDVTFTGTLNVANAA